jgi:hypothetical protein
LLPGSFGTFLLLLGDFGLSPLLLWGFRARPRTANHHKTGAPDQECPHDSHEVCLADHGATARCMCLLLLTPQSMPDNDARRISNKRYSLDFLEEAFSEVCRDQRKLYIEV